MPDKTLLLEYLNRVIETHSTNHRAPFLGKIKPNRFYFRVKREFPYRNSFEPNIVGRVNGDSLKLSIELNRMVGIYISVVLAFIFLLGIFKSPHITLLIITIASTFFYALGALFYSIDIKKYRRVFEEFELDIKQIHSDSQSNQTLNPTNYRFLE